MVVRLTFRCFYLFLCVSRTARRLWFYSFHNTCATSRFHVS